MTAEAGAHEPTEGEAYRYWAFISYSHRDAQWAEWLHKRVEAYAVPRELIGRELPVGKLPRRLFPVFRDRVELASSAELGPLINAALRGSRYQIVICSPHAASSRWVNEEIRYFKSLGRAERVLALIIDGEPGASLRPTLGQPECLPPALRFQVDRDGQLLDLPSEPIAADARSGKDGRSGALLKLLAGMLGVRLDELRQREKRRQRWRVAGYVASGLAVAAALAGVWQLQAHRQALAVAAQHRERLVELGQAELDAAQPARAAVYLGEAYRLGDESPALRYRIARAMEGVDPLVRVFRHGALAPNNWTTAALSPDGTRVISGSNADNTAVVWDAKSGRRLLTLDTGAWVGHVGFAPDGLTMFSSSHAQFRLWDARTGQLRHEITGAGPPGVMLWIAISNDSSRVWTRHVDGSFHLYATATAAPIELPLPAGSSGLAVAPNAREWAAISADRQQIEILPVGSAQPRLRLPVLAAQSLVFSPDEQMAATLAADGAVSLWDLRDGRERAALRVGGAGGALSFSPDGRTLALSVSADSVSFWPVATTATTAAAYLSTRATAWSPDGSWFVVRQSNSLRFWNPRTGSVAFTLGGHAAPVVGMAFDPSGEHLLSVARDNSARLWRVPPQRSATLRSRTFSDALALDAPPRLRTLDNEGLIETWLQDGARLTRQSSVRSAANVAAEDSKFSVDGRRVLARVEQADIALLDADSGAQLARFSGIEHYVFSEDGRYVVIYDDGAAGIYAADDGRLLRKFALRYGDTHSPWLVEIAPDGARVAVAATDAPVRIYRMADGEQLQELDVSTRNAWGVSWSKDGTTLGVDDGKGRFSLWSSTDATQLRSYEIEGRNIGLIAMPDRALQNAENELRLWNLHTGKATPLRGIAQISQVALHPQGRLIAASGFDGSACLWDADSGELIERLNDPGRAIGTLRFSADGRRLATSYAFGVAGLWPIVEPESRTAAQLAAVLQCSAPWKLDGESLAPFQPGSDCE